MLFAQSNEEEEIHLLCNENYNYLVVTYLLPLGYVDRLNHGSKDHGPWLLWGLTTPQIECSPLTGEQIIQV